MSSEPRSACSPRARRWRRRASRSWCRAARRTCRVRHRATAPRLRVGFTGSAGTAVIRASGAAVDRRPLLPAGGGRAERRVDADADGAGRRAHPRRGPPPSSDGATVGIDLFVSVSRRSGSAARRREPRPPLTRWRSQPARPRVGAAGRAARAASAGPLRSRRRRPPPALDGARGRRAPPAPTASSCACSTRCWLLNVRGSDVPCCPSSRLSSSPPPTAARRPRRRPRGLLRRRRCARRALRRAQFSAIRRAIRRIFGANSLTSPPAPQGAGGAPHVARGGGRGGAAV